MTDRFEQALAIATAQLMSEFGEDLLGLLLAGSAAYGTPMRSSDLDLYVLIRPRWRQRRNEIVEGVEVEMRELVGQALLRRFCELMPEPVGGVMLEGRTLPEPVP